jgi:hypothetical protein
MKKGDVSQLEKKKDLHVVGRMDNKLETSNW